MAIRCLFKRLATFNEQSMLLEASRGVYLKEPNVWYWVKCDEWDPAHHQSEYDNLPVIIGMYPYAVCLKHLEQLPQTDEVKALAMYIALTDGTSDSEFQALRR